MKRLRETYNDVDNIFEEIKDQSLIDLELKNRNTQKRKTYITQSCRIILRESEMMLKEVT